MQAQVNKNRKIMKSLFKTAILYEGNQFFLRSRRGDEVNNLSLPSR